MTWGTPKTNWSPVDGVTDADLIRIEENIRILSQYGGPFGVATGSANAYSVTASPPITSLVEGARVVVEINVDNTGASTINVNALGAKSIKKANGNDVAAGNLKANTPYTLVYNGANFILQGEGGGEGTATTNDVVEGTTFTNTQGGPFTGVIRKEDLIAAVNDVENNVNTYKTDLATKMGAPYTSNDTFATLLLALQSDKDSIASALTSQGKASNGTDSLDSLVAKIQDGAMQITAGDTYSLIYDKDGAGGSGSTLTERIAFVMSNAKGTIRVKFQTPALTTYTRNYRVYINGIAVGTNRVASGTFPQTIWTEDFSVNVGDRVSIYSNTTGGQCPIDWVRLTINEIPPVTQVVGE